MITGKPSEPVRSEGVGPTSPILVGKRKRSVILNTVGIFSVETKQCRWLRGRGSSLT
jgi:hypothetical protein